MLLEVLFGSFLATSRGDIQRQAQKSMGPKTSNSSKSDWKGQNKHSEDGRFQSFEKSSRSSGGAFGSGGPRHGNSLVGQNKKLPPF